MQSPLKPLEGQKEIEIVPTKTYASPLKSPRKAALGNTVPASDNIAWHALPVDQVLQLLETSEETGLSDAEAQHRRDTMFGPNVLTPPKKISFLARVWAQVNNVLIWILLCSAIVCVILSKWAEVTLILLVVSVNIIIGLIQEGKAEKAAEALKAMLSPQATVVRSGARKLVDAAELVPGDIIFLQSGDRVPADVRLCNITKLQILEAVLTGESLPISKHTRPVLPLSPLGDRKCLGFAATLVMSGQGLGIVVETGDFAEVGKINALVSGVESGKTNLTVQLEIFGRWISFIVAFIAVSTLLVAVLGRGFPVGNAFTAAVAVAVAIIPEGLPAVVTIVLAIGTQSMARQHAIIKSLPAVETLGSVMVICSDKTGTLTKNEMTAVAVRTSDGLFRATGTGYSPHGTLVKQLDEGGKTSPCSAEALEGLKIVAVCGALCSDADLRAPTAAGTGGSSEVWTAVGDPTEVALITLCAKLGLDHTAMRNEVPRVGTIPFESEHKFMGTAHKAHVKSSISNANASDTTAAASGGSRSNIIGVAPGETVLFVKGAPDRLIPRCTRQLSQGAAEIAAIDGSVPSTVPADHSFWLQQAKELSSQGLRVLALCKAVVPDGYVSIAPSNSALDEKEGGGDAEEGRSAVFAQKLDLSPLDVSSGPLPLTILALVAIMDPPRDEAGAAILEAHAAGITVKMITGDHRDTALSIGRMLHIAKEGDVAYTGSEVDAMTDAQLDAIILGCNVFARASPENKIRIVKSLQRLKQVTSMTGDGVNDAPALRAANIGVAMGITGTDVSKEAAKMVLADDNFATIVVAVKEGRRVWDNLVKILIYNTPVNIAQGMSTFFAFALAMPEPPLTALSTLYVNMITSVAMGMAFAFEPYEHDIMQRPPRKPEAMLFGIEVLWRNFFVGGIMLVAILGTFELAILGGATLSEARAEAFTQLVMGEVAYVWNCRYLRTHSFRVSTITGNPWIILSVALTVGLQIIIIYTPGLNTFFYCSPMPAIAWGRVIGFSTLIFLIVEVEKQLLHFIRPSLSRALSFLMSVVPSALRMPGNNGAAVAASTVEGVPAVPTSEPQNLISNAPFPAPIPLVEGTLTIRSPLPFSSSSVTSSSANANAQKSQRSSPFHGAVQNSEHTIEQAQLDSVHFYATSTSSFGIPVTPGGVVVPGEAAHRPVSLSTAEMFNLSSSQQIQNGTQDSRTRTVSAVGASLGLGVSVPVKGAI
jgi:magnesium-transporting ATPase (P-type)